MNPDHRLLRTQVRNDANPSRVYLEYDVRLSNGPGFVVVVNTTDAVLTQKGVSSKYDLGSAMLPQTALSTTQRASVNIAADLEDGTVTTAFFRPFIGQQKRCTL